MLHFARTDIYMYVVYGIASTGRVWRKRFVFIAQEANRTKAHVGMRAFFFYPGAIAERSTKNQRGNRRSTAKIIECSLAELIILFILGFGRHNFLCSPNFLFSFFCCCHVHLKVLCCHLEDRVACGRRQPHFGIIENVRGRFY